MMLSLGLTDMPPLSTALLLLVLATAAAAPSPATQLRLTFHPDPDTLVAGFTSMGAAPPGATLVQSGPAPDALGAPSSGTSVVFGNQYCPNNSSRTSHAAPFPAPAGAVTYYRVSADGGATWSDVTAAHNPARGFPMSIALWGDMGIECGGVLPPQPGFAGGPCTAVPQIAADSAAGAHAWTAHFGDVAYNMDDRCGAKGDAFLDAAATYSASRPAVYGNGNHEGSGPLKPYTEFVQRLGFPQGALAKASGSSSVRWMSWAVGPVTFVSLDADAWIYPLVYPLLDEQYAWLQRALTAFNRAATPWLIVLNHRASYCTKSEDDECNSEAEAIRNGQLGVRAPLEPLLAKFGADLYFAGHTHHYERTWPVVRGAATQANYVEPRGTVHVQSGIAGTGPGDEFTVPQQPWEAFRDTAYWPTYGRLTLLNATHARYEQLFNANGTVFDAFDLVNTQPAHGAPF